MRLELALVWTLTLMVKWGNTQQSSDGSSKEALLKIARDYRDGADGVQKSPLRAARFYEFIIDRSSNSGENTTSISDATAEFELSELLVQDPTLSAKHSYLTTLIRAAAGGHSEAQHKLSVAYGTGIAARDIVPMDAGRAVFLEYMSALSGNVLANLGMGYRYFQGIGVAESCDASLPHYEFAANVAAQTIEEQGLQITQPDTLKLSEANDPAGKWSKRESTQELTDYYAQLAEQGDVMAALTLGNMLLVGTRMAPANITRALHFLDLAAEANNPSAAGLQGYVMLQQHLHAARREATLHDGDLAMAQRFSQSEASEATIAKVLRLLRMAGKKNDVNGVLGLGLAYFHGVGVSANLTKAVEHIQRAVGVHVDAGYYLGEICMGLQSMELSVTSQFSRTYVTSNNDDVTTDGIVKGKNAVETRMIENHMIRQAQNKKIIDTAAATRGYMMSAQMGHVLAQHRLAHLQKRGLGGSFNCKETARLFKAVAERGPWMEQLAEAHAMYTEGNNLRAMYLFAQLAAVGVESAQYNAAYLVSKCTLCPPMDKEASLIGLGGAHSQSSASGSDPLETQHRLKQQSAETNFRLLLKDHEDREKSEKINNEEARAPNAEPAHRHAPNVQTNQRPSAPVAHEGSFAYYTPSNAAFLPSKEWRGFVMMYNTFHLSEQSDQELEDSLPVDHIESMKDSCRVMRKQLCETRALTLFDLSAQQGNAEAYVQIGDMYYYQRAGLTYPGRKKEAAEFYQRAADLHHTQAIFNLGIMHEVGDGVRQDFHLAKRFYDQAAEVDSKARAPRDIALLMLEGHKTYHALFGAEATTHLLALKVPLLTQSFLSSTGWTVQMYTLWQVIEKIVALETELRGLIDRWVMRYHLHVLHPVRDVLDLLTAPLQRFQPLQAWKHEAHNAPQDNAAPALKVEHSFRGYAKLVSTFPEYAKSLYDKAFDAVYLLLYYLIRGKPHPALSDRHLSTHDIHALREELLLLILLCMVFCMVLSFKVVRRRLNEAVHEQRPHNQRA